MSLVSPRMVTNFDVVCDTNQSIREKDWLHLRAWHMGLASITTFQPISACYSIIETLTCDYCRHRPHYSLHLRQVFFRHHSKLLTLLKWSWKKGLWLMRHRHEYLFNYEFYLYIPEDDIATQGFQNPSSTLCTPRSFSVSLHTSSITPVLLACLPILVGLQADVQ